VWIGGSDADIASLADVARRLPFAAHAVAVDSALAAHLAAASGTLVLIRPDAYVAATIATPTPERVEAALRRALALDADAR
ncbi:MAG TPA: hypothetical protein VFF43_02770, partial [Caldimonas sp.]|nr:hypothetical protein [Caldimonas sp.]